MEIHVNKFAMKNNRKNSEDLTVERIKTLVNLKKTPLEKLKTINKQNR